MIKAVFKGLMFTWLLMAMSFPVWAAEKAPQNSGPGQMVPVQLAEVPKDIQLDRDIVFATMGGHELKLDIAYPKAGKGKIPAVIYIHGGGWSMGDKDPNQALIYAKNGFAGIAIQYRLSGVALFPAAVHDCKAAIRWVRANAEKYGIDPDRIGIMGESAGGHLVALLGTSGGDKFLEGDGPYGEYSSRVQAVVDNFGPIDLMNLKETPSPMDPTATSGPITAWLGKPAKDVPELAKKANPITYLDAGDPPVLMMHGDKDSLVPFQQSELFYAALTKAGVKSKLVQVKNAGHGFSPDPQGATISPGADEIVSIQMAWFKEIFKMK
jgi:acetyl esterase/lipase